MADGGSVGVRAELEGKTEGERIVTKRPPLRVGIRQSAGGGVLGYARCDLHRRRVGSCPA